MDLIDLPKNLIIHLCIQLDIFDLLQFGRINKKIFGIFKNNLIWKKLYSSNFTKIFQKITNNKSLKQRIYPVDEEKEDYWYQFYKRTVESKK
jgi:hypothetical protein